MLAKAREVALINKRQVRGGVVPLAKHYGIAISPVRHYEPRDKAKVVESDNFMRVVFKADHFNLTLSRTYAETASHYFPIARGLLQSAPSEGGQGPGSIAKGERLDDTGDRQLQPLRPAPVSCRGY